MMSFRLASERARSGLIIIVYYADMPDIEY